MDGDKAGSKNSRVRYEIIHGNYERKFSIDEVTGVITVKEPLNLGLDDAAANIAARRRNNAATGRRRTRLKKYMIWSLALFLKWFFSGGFVRRRGKGDLRTLRQKRRSTREETTNFFDGPEFGKQKLVTHQ